MQAVAYAPDGASVAIAGRAQSGVATKVWVFPADFSAAPRDVATFEETNRDVDELTFSPNGEQLAVRGGFSTETRLYIVAVDGSDANTYAAEVIAREGGTATASHPFTTKD
ncbi:MAG: hypothetical protein AAGA56_27125, partial [Myxococcota bacterium]